MQHTPFKEDTFRSQLKQLMDYLHLTAGEFSKNCDITSRTTIQNYLDGKFYPTHRTLSKIMKRYPVPLPWLVLNEGKMWNDQDYFEKRFIEFKDECDNTIASKIENLMKIFEANQSQLGSRLGVGRHTIHKLCKGKLTKLEDEYLDQFTSAVSFIPREYYTQ